RYAQLPQVLALHGVALAGLIVWLQRPVWRHSRLTAPLLVFLLIEILSIVSARNPVASVLPISTHLAGVALTLSLLNGLSKRDFKFSAEAACAVAGLLSVFGVLQFLGIGHHWVPTSGLPSATFGHRNLAAAYLVGMVPLTGWLWWEATTQKKQAAWAIGLGFESAFLLATRSRGAWVGVIGAVVLFIFIALLTQHLRWRVFGANGRRWLQLGCILVFAAGIASVPAKIEKGAGEAMWHGKQDLGTAVVSLTSEGGDKGRWSLWRSSLEMIADHPVRGIGAGNWRLMFPVYAHDDMIDSRTVPFRPHNDPLWIWAEMGTLGFLVYGWLLGTAGLLGWRVAQKDFGGWALLCGLCAVVASSLFGFPRAFPGAWLPFYICLAGIGISTLAEKQTVPFLKLVLVGAILVVGISGWGVLRQIEFDRHLLPARLAFAQERWQDVHREACFMPTLGSMTLLWWLLSRRCSLKQV
ncbi:MAG: O-antigen ligase family protein, partial [Candidatus Latescibacteria bacterium]|nr:O-antigen ligase family protein [Candidatus Latescibacterota bacterium]